MIKSLVILFLKGYQQTLSLVLGQRCRFYPSCSSYAIEAVEEFGVAKGLPMAIGRLSRCHPFHPGGFDPVPHNDQKQV